MSELPDQTVPLPLAAYDLVPPVESCTLSDEGLNNAHAGIRTGAGDFVVRSYTSLSYDDPASIHYEHRLLAWLAGRELSFAVPAPVPARDGALLWYGPHAWMSLSAWLPGARLDPRRLDHLELLGAAVGELQAALRHYPPAPRPGRPLFGTLFRFPLPYRNPLALTPEQLGLPDTPPYGELLRWWRDEAARLQAFVDGAYRTLPHQVCHNDVTPNNLLVDGGRLAAVLDWEFATLAPRALDVAMGLRMAMRIWDNPEPWEEIRRFCRGYTRWMRVVEDEVQALPWLIRLRTAITVLWWIGRTAPTGEVGPIPDRIEMLQNTVGWLERYEQQLLDVVMQEVA